MTRSLVNFDWMCFSKYSVYFNLTHQRHLNNNTASWNPRLQPIQQKDPCSPKDSGKPFTPLFSWRLIPLLQPCTQQPSCWCGEPTGVSLFLDAFLLSEDFLVGRIPTFPLLPPVLFQLSPYQALLFFFFFFFFLSFSRATPAAYGGSWARGPIWAVATGLCQSHSNATSEPHLRPTPQLTETPDP